MSERKRFDRELFEKYDKAAREVTTKVLKSKGYVVVEHPDRYAQDLIAYMPLDDYEFNVECEVKRVWKDRHISIRICTASTHVKRSSLMGRHDSLFGMSR